MNANKKLMGLGAFACGVWGAKKAFGGFGAFEAWQTAGLNANIKSYSCGEGLERLKPGKRQA